MKKITIKIAMLAAFLLSSITVNAQNGSSPDSAIVYNIGDTAYTQTQQIQWFVFGSESDSLNITIINNNFGVSDKITKIILFTRDSSYFNQIASDTISAANDSVLNIVIKGLIPISNGLTSYYLKIFKQDNTTAINYVLWMGPQSRSPINTGNSSSSTNCINLCTFGFVPNGDFETPSFPAGTGNGTIGSGALSSGDVCGWRNTPTPLPLRTSDYYSTAPQMLGNGVPCNFFGTQSDNISGNSAYVGIWGLDTPGNPYGNTWNEVPTCLLVNALQPSTQYQLEMDASLSDAIGTWDFPLQVLLSANTLADFSSGFHNPSGNEFTLPQNGNYLVNGLPNTQPFNGAYEISQCTGWTHIAQTFTTGSNANANALIAQLYVGRITSVPWVPGPNPSGCDASTCGTYASLPANETGSYVYIDNISIREVVPPAPTLQLPEYVCENEIVTLSAGFGSAGWWSGTDVSSNGVFNTTGLSGPIPITYHYTYNYCQYQQTAIVTVIPEPTISIGPLTACVGVPYTPPAFTTFPSTNVVPWWYNEPITPLGGLAASGTGNLPTFTPTTVGTFTLTVYPELTPDVCWGNTFTFTITVLPAPTVTINTHSQTICAGTEVTLSATGSPSGGTYVWNGPGTSYSNGGMVHPTSTTTYWLRYTDPQGCSVTINPAVTITVNPLPTVTVNSPTICAGSTATLTANGATTYTWSAGATSTGVYTATATPAVTTTYTVTGTLNGCSNTATAIVTVNPLPTVAVNSLILCTGTTATLTATGATTYSWAGTGITVTGVGTATVAPAVTSTYTVTGTTNNCSSTAVSTVTVAPVCCSFGSYNFYNETTDNMNTIGPPFISVVLGIPTVTGQSFSINGTFTLNENLTLYDCDVELGSMAKIILNGHTLTLNYSHLHGCSTLWDGIYLSIKLDLIKVNYSLIEDANSAINTNSGTWYYITNSVFNKNNTSITTSNNNSANGGTVNGSIFTSRNFFPLFGTTNPPPATCAASIFAVYTAAGVPFNNPTYPIVPIISGTPAMIGMEVSNITLSANTVPLLIGASGTGNGNIFDGLQIGIIEVKSLLSVLNNTFENIGTFAPPCSTCFPNICILTEQSGTINIGGASGAGNTFNNCQMGIAAEANNTTIDGNTFLSVWQCVDIGFNNPIPPTESTTIYDNNMGSASYPVRGGIYLKDVSLSGSTSIYSNYMYISSPVTPTINIDYFGIYYANTNPLTINCNVYENTIINPRYGIWFSNCSLAQIGYGTSTTGNKVLYASTYPFSSSYTYYGIRLTACTNINVNYNFAIYAGTPPSALPTLVLTGISVEKSQIINVYQNDMRNMTSGIYAMGNCNNSYFTCNTNNGCWFGFNFSAATIGSIQGAATASSNNKWENITTAAYRYITGNILLSTIWYCNSGADYDVTTAQNNTSTAGPITYISTSPGCTPPAIVAPIDHREKMLGKIVRNECVYDTLSNEFKLNDSIFAYKQLNSDTSMLHLGTTDDATYQSFYAAVQATPVGQFQQVVSLVQDSISPDTTAAMLINQNIPTTCSMQENQKIVNTIYLNELNNPIDTLGVPLVSPYDSAETVQLQNVAYQNPILGGDAVYMARVMLFIDVIDYGYEGADRHLVYNKPTQTPLLAIVDYKLYPNPNNGTMQLSYTLGENETGFLTITNVYGEQLATIKLVSSSTILNINETQLSNGVFFYQVYKNNQRVYSDKIIISK